MNIFYLDAKLSDIDNDLITWKYNLPFKSQVNLEPIQREGGSIVRKFFFYLSHGQHIA